MKDPASEIKEAYFTRLNDIEAGVKCYDGVDMDATFPYIYFNSVVANTATPENKQGRGFAVGVTLTVVTASQGNSGGFRQADLLSRKITEAIGTARAYITTNSFQVITTTLESANNISEKYQSGMLYKRILTFRHLIAELTNE